MTDDLKRSPLEHRHLALGGRMVPFAGYSMPVQYSGIKEEHRAVRQNVGLFDVSHMGQIEFKGSGAVAAVDRLITNDFSTVTNTEAMYSVMCTDAGGILDDVIAYRLSAEHVLVCVNASNRAKDFEHMRRHTSPRGDVEVTDTTDDWVLLAVQGPRAAVTLEPITDGDVHGLGFRRSMWTTVGGRRVLITRGGYTGEDGFELYIPRADGEAVFDAVMEAGTDHGMLPCGLGCRDTLRLEAKLLLYGSDIDETVDPFEAGLGWVVKLDKPAPFIGQERLREIKAEGVQRRLRGLVLEDRGVLRPDYPIFADDQQVGTTTSGSFSPTLEQSIGLGWIDVAHADDETVEVEIRSRRLRARLTKKPFYRRES